MRLLRLLTNRSIASLLEVYTGVLLFNIKKFLKCTSSTSQPLQQTCLPILGKLYDPQQHESSSLLYKRTVFVNSSCIVYNLPECTSLYFANSQPTHQESNHPT